MIALRRVFFTKGALIALMVSLVLSAAIGCSREPERTEDPAEIEKLRQEHLERSQREWQESQR